MGEENAFGSGDLLPTLRVLAFATAVRAECASFMSKSSKLNKLEVEFYRLEGKF